MMEHHATHNATHKTTAVIVIGAGPTGLSLSLMLARFGVRSCLIEPNLRPQQHPAACILNTRTMEIFRELRLADAILDTAQDIFQRSAITWVTSLAGRELGRLNAAPSDLAQVLSHSPVHATHFPQNRLEPLLWNAVTRQPLISIYSGCRLHDLVQDENRVIANVHVDSTSQSLQIEGKWLVGCDGASSRTRALAQIPWDGDLIQPMINIHFTANLEALVAHRPSILYWVFNRRVLGVLIAHWLPTEWVLMTPFFPPAESLGDYNESRCRTLVSTAIGDARIPFHIEHIGRWALSARQARTFRANRVFLAGDAAHTFPPTGGLGLNTGVQDAHNLAWKLAWVLRDNAASSLLDTYQTERQPVARANVDHSVRNYNRMDELLQPAGLSTQKLRLLNRLQRSAFFPRLPTSFQRKSIRACVSLALRRLDVFNRDTPGGERARAAFQAALPGQLPHYQFLGLDLGFAYRSNAILSEDSPQPRADDPISEYLPTTWPGARLPHCWLNENAPRQSTLDVACDDALVLIATGAAYRVWHEAVAHLQATYHLPVSCVNASMSRDGDASDRVSRSADHLQPTPLSISGATNRAFFVPSPPVPAGGEGGRRPDEGVSAGQILNGVHLQPSWTSISEVSIDGAVLVRPDGHIAWRSQGMPSSPINELLYAVSRILDVRRSEPLLSPSDA